MLTGRQSLGLGISWAFGGAAIIAVTLRLYSRLKIEKKIAGWDDAVIVLALIIFIITNSFNAAAIAYGAGRHLGTLPPLEAIEAGKWTVISDAVGLFSFTVPKLSVAILLSRILTVGEWSPRRTIAICAPAVFLILFSFAALGVWLGQCYPIAALWNPIILEVDPNAHCLNPFIYRGIGIALGSCSAAADFFYASYPIFIIAKLQTSRARKIHLMVVLGLGIVGGACAIWKTASFPATSAPHADVTYAAVSLSIANIAEAGVLIIAACVPGMGPAIRSTRNYVSTLRSTRADEAFTQLSDTYGESNKMVQSPSRMSMGRHISTIKTPTDEHLYELHDV